jgi:hypothetical protein
MNLWDAAGVSPQNALLAAASLAITNTAAKKRTKRSALTV